MFHTCIECLLYSVTDFNNNYESNVKIRKENVREYIYAHKELERNV